MLFLAILIHLNMLLCGVHYKIPFLAILIHLNMLLCVVHNNIPF